MASNRAFGWGIVSAILVMVSVTWAAEPAAPAEAPAKTESSAPEKPRFAGPTDSGFLLPNGWHLTPAGEHIVLSDLPLNIIPLSDNKHALVATDGWNSHYLSLINLETKAVVTKVLGTQSWFGLALHDEKRVFWSGGGSSTIYDVGLKGDQLKLNKVMKLANKDLKVDNQFRSGLAVDADKELLYTLDIEQGTITAIDLAGKKENRSGKIGERPYDVLIGPGGKALYVSDWADRSVLVVSPTDLRSIARIPVGEHPNQIVKHPKDDRLFVACASSNSVCVIDASRGIVTETIFTQLFPKAPEGSTPCALALSPDGEYLYVANADNNAVAVVEVEEPSHSQVKGFIPTGWYPTSLAVTPDNKRLLVGIGKGLQTKANPFGKVNADKPEDQPKEGERPARKRLPYPYIGSTLSGALSIVAIPDEEKLRDYTAQVYRNCPYSDELLTGTKFTGKTAIPIKLGDKSPITHVIYIIKENRTYDQVLGDMPEGNGDPSLVMFGEEVTPNHHKLAREFVLLDNLYCNGHVSRDGHPWSTMAYNTDWIARDWALTYSGRGGIDDDDDGDLSRAPSGYIWDACARAGLTYRTYGEYGNRVSQADGTTTMEARVPGLVGHINEKFGIPKVKGQRSRDPENVKIFLEEFNKYLETDSLPRFIIMSLGEDHTSGTSIGAPSPEACVASNDLALGQLVDAVSRSKIWPNVAIFVIEDDAQNGPDHIDAHRTVGLVISPYTKRKYRDSTQYSTVSMLRTMELILGLDPLSQFDAAATAMYNSFTDQPNLAPYDHLPARIDLEKRNTALSYGADRSNKMDFSEYDRIDDFELNEILWRAVKGKDAPIPPAVRRAIAYRVGK